MGRLIGKWHAAARQGRVSESMCLDRNTDTTFGGSADSDCLDSGGSARYFYHQDANYRVAALTDESAAVIERYEYDAYGEPRVYAGGTGVQTLGAGNLLSVSAVGNPLMHQGLRRDDETGLHENRMRVLHSRLGRFMQRDPVGYIAGMNRYSYGASARPVSRKGAKPQRNVKIGAAGRGSGFARMWQRCAQSDSIHESRRTPLRVAAKHSTSNISALRFQLAVGAGFGGADRKAGSG